MKEECTRLHITPFNPDLLPVILGPSLLASAANISFNTIQTFPENNYGFLDLPVMDAEKVKKKINGAILKGKKIKVEEARPRKRRRIEDSDEKTALSEGTTEEKKAKKPKKEKKEKKDRNVIPGHELPTDRRIKRGWTEANKTNPTKTRKGETKVPASKYSDKDELMFRTKLPENRSDGQAQGKEKGNTKQRKGGYVVHEFAKSTKQPSFLRQDVGLGIKGNLEYTEGQGWVNEAGETVEQESDRVLRQRETATAASRPKPPAPKISQRSPTPSSSASSSLSSSSEDDDSASQRSREKVARPINEGDDETSSSGSSSESESDGPENATENEMDDNDTEETGDPVENEVHPLEALFKKPKKPTSQDIAKPSLEVSTSFSFFDPQDEDEIEKEPRIPGTPFSSQDIRARGLRSAAPTPDTAYPSRFNSYGSTGLPGDEVDEDDNNDDKLEKAPSSKKGRDSTNTSSATPSRNQSEFERKFWENRGENNRAWKQRRRTVLKEKRQRENKAHRPKNW
jgi:hypothetical protein